MGAVVLDTSVILALFDPGDALHTAAASAVRRHRAGRATFAQAITAFGPPVPVDESVAAAAARLRARHRSLRLPDALVLATADVLAAEAVLAGDAKWPELDSRVELIGG